MSWGYGNCSTTSFAQDLQNNKSLINTTESGTKVYKSIVGTGISEIKVLWHDNRSNNFNSKIIIRKSETSTVFDVTHLKFQKQIYEFAQLKLVEAGFVSMM